MSWNLVASRCILICQCIGTCGYKLEEATPTIPNGQTPQNYDSILRVTLREWAQTSISSACARQLLEEMLLALVGDFVHEK